jgi:exodeoxyribonuclease VII small subunit
MSATEVSDAPNRMVTMTEQAPLAELSFEQARDELQQVIVRLEQGSPSLEESLGLWERGEALARHCEEWLVGAKRRLDAARASTDAPAAEES